VKTIDLPWPSFISLAVERNLSLQCVTTDGTYEIFCFDDKVEYRAFISRSGMPLNSPISDADNTSYLVDFEANYLDIANKPLVQRAATGVVAQAVAKGLGDFAPAPTNNPYAPDADEPVSLYVDAEGSVVTRGTILTDEGSLRDDFTGSALETDLTGTLTFTNGSHDVTGSGTLFTQEVTRNHYLKIKTDTVDKWVAVTRAPTDTTLELAEPYQGATASATAHKTRWVSVGLGGTPGSATMSSSRLTLTTGTVSGCGRRIWRQGDFAPMLLTWVVSVSQRIANQEIAVGFVDDPSSSTPQHYAEVVFDGTDNTKIKFRSAWAGDEESTTLTLPTGLDTSQSLRYKIELTAEHCALLVNGVLCAKHETHVPDMYIDLALRAQAKNTATAASTTSLVIDSAFWVNTDRVEVAHSFQEPMPIITKEDQHSVFGKVTTILTTANQTIISYTVPAGKVLWLIGYRVDMEGTITGLVKIGRSPLPTEPAGPGTLDSNLFRAFVLQSSESTGDVDFGSNPRKLGVGGDTILVTVTPSAILSTVWRAALDFVLR
jgi:hypothetical protein